MPSQLATPFVWGLSSALYVFNAIFLLYGMYENHFLLKRSHPTLVLGLFFLSQLFRAVWMMAKVHDLDDALAWKLFSRLSTLLQLTAVSCMVFRWYKTVLMFQTLRDRKPVKYAKYFFGFLNGFFYIAVFATTRSQENAKVDDMYRINQLLLALSFVVVLGMSITIGKKLRNTIAAPQSRVKSASTTSEKEAENIKNVVLPKIIATSWSLFLCFTIRALVSSWTPITGEHSTPWQTVDTIIYPLCFYHIPELIPAFIITWSFLSSVHTKSLKLRFSNKFKRSKNLNLSSPMANIASSASHGSNGDEIPNFNPFTKQVV